MHYQSTGDFKIKNDHFLSFQEMYSNDSEMFLMDSNDNENSQLFIGQGVTGTYKFNWDKEVEICGSPSNLQPHELKFLWTKKSGLIWKIRLLIAVKKIPLLEKLTERLYKKSRSYTRL